MEIWISTTMSLTVKLIMVTLISSMFILFNQTENQVIKETKPSDYKVIECYTLEHVKIYTIKLNSS